MSHSLQSMRRSGLTTPIAACACVGSCDTSAIAQSALRTLAHAQVVDVAPISGIFEALPSAISEALAANQPILVVNGCPCRCISEYCGVAGEKVITVTLSECGIVRGKVDSIEKTVSKAVDAILERVQQQPGNKPFG